MQNRFLYDKRGKKCIYENNILRNPTLRPRVVRPRQCVLRVRVDYHRSHLNGNNALLAQGADAVCIFVNDTADAGTIRQLAAMGVKLIALRCAGFNNVDLKAAAEYGIPVVRVPACCPMPSRNMPWR